MILSALNDYYQRLLNDGSADIPRPGYSQEQISYAIVLTDDGGVADVLDIRDTSGKKLMPRHMSVPKKPSGGTSNILPKFLWDKTSYVLGISARSKRCEREHAAFKELHQSALANDSDPGLQALLNFLKRWHPEQFQHEPAFTGHGDALLDSNVVFRFGGEHGYLHERPAARAAWSRMSGANDSRREGTCLVTGERGSLARLHPPIKGFESTGSSIVSFNADAYISYKGVIEKLQSSNKENDSGANAPISVQAAFAYTTTLNYLLRHESRQKLRIGDATVVFWAEAPDRRAAAEAESLLAAFFDPRDDDKRAIKQVHDVLEQVRQGLPLHDLEGHLEDGTRIFVLGLAPNASRLSIRFWETQTLATFAQRLRWHFDDLRLEPSPWHTPPAVWKLLLATVPHREGSKPKSEDVPPQLAGELTRAILTGRRYPHSLLSNIIMRFRADGDISGTRVALCKGVLAREQRLDNKDITKGEPLVSLDPTNTDPGYLLGRLFSILENVQRAALGKEINATIRDRYYGAASATPASVFPVLLRNAQHHLSRVRKDKPGFAVNLEKEVGGIIDQLGPTFPKSLRIESQGHFAIGYYHQTQARFARTNITDIDSEGEDA